MQKANTIQAKSVSLIPIVNTTEVEEEVDRIEIARARSGRGKRRDR
jgi:hypothetical protein